MVHPTLFHLLPIGLAFAIILSPELSSATPVYDPLVEPLSLVGYTRASEHVYRRTGSAASLTVPLTRKGKRSFANEDDLAAWARRQGDNLNAKYGPHATSSRIRRANGTHFMINQNTDSTYFGTISVGTPPTTQNVILDTGSSDLWLAGLSCRTCDDTIPRFVRNDSSTFTNIASGFAVQYGSGSASGTLGRDVVSMAGFAVTDQVLAIIDTISPRLLSAPVSGIMGLAFRGIASSRASPFWQRLATSGAWDEPVMGFFLTRFLDLEGAAKLEPGGVFTLGKTDTSLYTGEVDWLDLPTGAGTYWQLEMTSLIIRGTPISLQSGSASYAAIDTGTTLIGGPSSLIDEVFRQVPGAVPGTDDFTNYWWYPCDTDVDVKISFGSRVWSIDSRDFELARLESGRCLGSFFKLNISGTAPQWIIGDTFLKNVYSIFRMEPPSIGFAELSRKALAMNSLGQTLPSPSSGVSTSISASSGSHVISLVLFSQLAIAVFSIIVLLAR